MKLLILSDSHECIDSMLESVAVENPGAVFHLGDHIQDSFALRARIPDDVPLYCVRGNCDYAGEDENLITILGKKIFYTHGHVYRVKTGLDEIARRGKEVCADLVLFGHTHMPYIGKSGKTLLMNPGSCGGRRWTGGAPSRKTYGVVTIDEKGIQCQIIEAGLSE
ncbi:MAG: metallophosphoesterase [Oscillospiraceae bacterium]|nr:metallophosphoesterase [Oscillospiraceae bacterium]